MAGRGRARGRGRGLGDSEASAPGGLAARNSVDEDESTPEVTQNSNEGESKTASGGVGQPTLSLNDMKSIIEDPRTYSEQNDVKKFLMCARHFVKTEEDVKTLSSMLYNNCLSDSSLAKRGSEICDALTCIEVGSTKFRNCLLSLVQADYKARKELIASDPARFRGFLAFLCEIFGVMRTANNEVFKPLVNPIFDCFILPLGQEDQEEEEGGEGGGGGGGGDMEMLNDDVCELFAIQLQSVGKLLEENEEERMRQLMNRIRTCIIHSKSSPRVRCSLLEVLESYARGWESADSETTKFYCDMAVDMISGLVL
ncbi:CBP80/20-dependent translation initiation factor [Aplysia californica]|uniref:CBP80/20-dependent translation initiation factor n=1 Tax=Aplysia californica TaxID=6500 RepID=A0ABM1W4K6_APLCA|nr:CBP80/20-dependent translation initiation factor [Aplysia californica]XP_005113330.1 CBP80/20-dependent translation initiation factor [Aplysia californica]XP_035829599.1 CBP80/20-dependent translation initiation factor [Aplysia californica]